MHRRTQQMFGQKVTTHARMHTGRNPTVICSKKSNTYNAPKPAHSHTHTKHVTDTYTLRHIIIINTHTLDQGTSALCWPWGHPPEHWLPRLPRYCLNTSNSPLRNRMSFLFTRLKTELLLEWFGTRIHDKCLLRLICTTQTFDSLLMITKHLGMISTTACQNQFLDHRRNSHHAELNFSERKPWWKISHAVTLPRYWINTTVIIITAIMINIIMVRAFSSHAGSAVPNESLHNKRGEVKGTRRRPIGQWPRM